MYTLDKQVFNKLETGWLAPNGDWYPCEYTEHLMCADELWRIMGQEWTPDVEQKLLEMGWKNIFECRISKINPDAHYENQIRLTIRIVRNDK